MPRLFAAFLLLTSFVLLTSLPALAEEAAEKTGEEAPPDRVSLANGDRLSGTVLRLAGGTLVLETSYAGAVEIDFAQVTAVTTAEPLTVRLEAGDVEARLVEVDGGLALAVEGGEPRAVAAAEIVAIEPPPDVTFEAALSLGANLQRGNTEQTTLFASADAVRRSERLRLSGRLSWNDAKENDVQTSESLFGAFKADRFWSETAYVYASAELLSDEFKNLDLRSAVSVGVGYQPYDGERLSFSVEGGLSYLYRDFASGGHEDEISLRAATRLGWEVFDGFELTDYLVLYPSFEDDSLELRNELALTTEILGGWALRFSSILEHDTDPDFGLEKTDYLWILGLQYRLR